MPRLEMYCTFWKSRVMRRAAADMLAWESSGFSVDASVRIAL
jgi:hypothetical protein